MPWILKIQHIYKKNQTKKGKKPKTNPQIQSLKYRQRLC